MENLLEAFNTQIFAVLDECKPSETPTVCSLISTKEGKRKVFELIQKMVIKQKLTIGESITRIEQEFDINNREN